MGNKKVIKDRKAELNKDTLAEFCGEIVDIFEDYCDKNYIIVTNPERDEYNRDAGYEEGENNVAIFGDDYDMIIGTPEDKLLTESGLRTRVDGETAKAIVDGCIESFRTILEGRGSVKEIPSYKEIGLRRELYDLLEAWGVFLGTGPFRLYMTLQMDRKVKEDDCISPGSYTITFNGKTVNFDFMDTEWSKDEDKIHVVQRNPDTYFEDLYILELDDLRKPESIQEVYVYTGEGDEEDIRPLKILEMGLRLFGNAGCIIDEDVDLTKLANKYSFED